MEAKMAITISENRKHRTDKFIDSVVIEKNQDQEIAKDILRRIHDLDPNRNDFLSDLNKLLTEADGNFRQLFNYENKLRGWLARTFIPGFDANRKKEIIVCLQLQITERITFLENSKPVPVEYQIFKLANHLNILRQAAFAISTEPKAKQKGTPKSSIELKVEKKGIYSIEKSKTNNEYKLVGGLYEKDLKDKTNFENFKLLLSEICRLMVTEDSRTFYELFMCVNSLQFEDLKSHNWGDCEIKVLNWKSKPAEDLKPTMTEEHIAQLSKHLKVLHRLTWPAPAAFKVDKQGNYSIKLIQGQTVSKLEEARESKALAKNQYFKLVGNFQEKDLKDQETDAKGKTNFENLKLLLDQIFHQMKNLSNFFYDVNINVSSLRFEDINSIDWSACHRRILYWTPERQLEYNILCSYKQNLTQEMSNADMGCINY
jgi:hypothetical protein